MPSITRYSAVMGFGLALAGCASSPGTTTAALVTPAAAAEPPRGGYVLSAEEQAWDCKKLTGKMQVYILELRGGSTHAQTTSASRLLHSAVTGTIGGSKSGGDPATQDAKDRAMLEAYNRQLVAKGCKSYNLDEALHPKDPKESPRANVLPPGGVKPAK